MSRTAFEASSFWDEGTDTSELHWRGHVFRGENAAVHELMGHLNAVEAMSIEVRELACRHVRTSRDHEDALVRAFRHLDVKP